MAAGGDFLSKFVFQAVLVDEVAQATELSAVVPVILRGAKRTVYVGDHCQLPPSVISSEAEMRGLSFSVYSRLTSSGGLSPFLLDTQYRSHPKLAEFSSTAFYDGKVASGITMGDRVPPKGIEWPNPNCPVVFINVDANEEVEAESKLNSVEAQLLAHIVSNVLQCGELKVEDVGVVTPYMAQVRRLRQYLRPMLPYGCDPRLLECSSVDNFQGREKELIIFSAVRSNERGNVGFLADWRRLNVMLTRPRRGLVVVGNAKTLKHDATWEKWFKFAEDNSCVVMDMKMPQINDMFQSEPQWQDDWGYGQKGDMWKGKFGSGQKGDMLKGKGGFGQKGDKGKGWNAWDDSWRPGASAWDLAWNLRHSAEHWGDDWGFGESWNAATWAGKGNNSWQAPGSQATMQTMHRGSAWENGGQSWDSSNSWADGHWGPDDRAWGSDSSWGGRAWEKQAEDFSNEQKESFKTALDKLRELKSNAVASAGEQAEASEWQQKRDQLMQIQREQLRKMVDDHRRDGGEREPDVAMIQDPEVSSMALEANARVGSSLPQVAAVPAATCLAPSGILQAATCAATNPAAHLTTSQSAAERFDAAAALHKAQTEQAAKLAQTQAATLAHALAQTQVAAGAQHTGTVQAGAAAVAQYAQLAQAQSAQLQNSLVANAAQAQFAQASGVAGQAQQAHVLQQVQQLQQLQQYQQLQQIQQAQMLQYQQLLQQQGSKS
jgi:regulator of nonsense transcripts 1